jgi:hypothetical protein
MALLSGTGKRDGLQPSPTRWTMPLCVLFVLTVGTTMQTQEIEEHRLKAAFMFNFAKFISWPHAESDSKLTVCIVNSKDVAQALEAVAKGKTVDAREVVIQQLSFPAPLESCRLLFIGSGGKKIDEVLLAAKELPVVTVGEDEKFLRRGGMINFVLDEGRLRFEINTDAVSHSGVTISSKLLNLAKNIRGKP